jgi:hypothetical protein
VLCEIPPGSSRSSPRPVWTSLAYCRGRLIHFEKGRLLAINVLNKGKLPENYKHQENEVNLIEDLYFNVFEHFDNLVRQPGGTD